MLKPIPVVLAQYDSEWPHLAKNLAEQLQVLGSCLVTVHHIGSTAVPGLTAKPTIDLMPIVTELAVLDAQHTCIEALGYKWHGEYGISGRRFCTLSDESGRRIAHLHFFTASSPHVERHIAFRDYLRAHPNVATAYEMEKRRVRDLHPDDTRAYADEKAAWVSKMESDALTWFAELRNTVPVH